MFLSSSIFNASGSLGFAPDLHSVKTQPSGLSRLAAFITNPISQAPRQPAAARCLLPFEGGFLFHSGLPNPGLRTVLKRYAARWTAAPLPIIPHLIASSPGEIEQMVRHLEGIDNIAGVEIGLPDGIDCQQAIEWITRAAGELSIIACLPFEDAARLTPGLKETPVSAISLAAPRGILPDAEGRLVQGRLYGPAILPSTLKVVKEVASLGFVVMGSGGVYCPEDVTAMLAAGANTVQVDTVLWGVEGVNILARW